MTQNTLLKVENLRTSFIQSIGEIHAVRGVNFSLSAGEALGIVGESGCGKSVTAKSITRLLPKSASIKSGRILYKGEDLVSKSERAMQRLRGRDISMIFQDPMTSLNPVISVGNQIVEAIRIHSDLSRQEAWSKAIQTLELINIASPESRMHQYPYELSGGMRQRIMIAIALSCNPGLLIADEPTTALDVTIQAQILSILKDLRSKLGVAIILITHDLGVVADLCDRVAVMYGGLIVEQGSIDDVFYSTAHPYTLGLLGAVPTLSMSKNRRLSTIHGRPPDLFMPPRGCPFAERCKDEMRVCSEEMPPEFEVSLDHSARCWLLHPKRAAV